MEPSLDQLRFRFQEDLALKNSLYSIGEIVLEYAMKVSGANAGVFLYSAPGIDHFEKVATIGLSTSEAESWTHCVRDSKLALPECIRTQNYAEVTEGNGLALMAFPLRDSDMAGAGFSISFSPQKKVPSETKDFLFWLAELAEHAIFNKDGEGV